jgi:segregation and condensation protein A
MILSPEKLRINIEVFEGPLDLLLYLIKKFELDIYDIPIAKITQEYLSYLELMKELNLDVAGEFLVMASTLINIKSQMLLPRPEGEADAVEEDPLAELQRRLLEYKRFKEASQLLEEREVLGIDVYNRPAEPLAAPPPLAEERVDTTLYELVHALKETLDRVSKINPKAHEVFKESMSLTKRIFEVIEMLKGRERVEFADLFADVQSRSMVVVTFLSLLELLKRRLVRAQQALPGSIIHIFPAGDFSDLGNVNFEDVEKEYAGGVEEPVEAPLEETEPGSVQ